MAGVMFLFGQRPIKLRAAMEVIMNLASLRQLPVEQRMHLVEELWDSIAADQEALPLTHEQRVELDQRLDAYEADGNPGRPATAALEDIRKRL
jgi:putative addiction module component (TIGR02574 family)